MGDLDLEADCQEIAVTWANWEASDWAKREPPPAVKLTDSYASVELYSLDVGDRCEDSADRVFGDRCFSHNFGNTATSVGVQEEQVDNQNIHKPVTDRSQTQHLNAQERSLSNIYRCLGSSIHCSKTSPESSPADLVIASAKFQTPPDERHHARA